MERHYYQNCIKYSIMKRFKKITYITIVILTLFFHYCQRQNIGLEIKTSQDYLQIKENHLNDTITYKFIVSNNSNKDLVIYNFGSNIEVYSRKMKNDKTGLKIKLLNNNEQIFPIQINYDSFEDFNKILEGKGKEVINQLNAGYKEELIKNKIWLLPYTSKEINVKFSLMDYDLKEGIYDLYFYYYQDKNILQFVKSDLLKFDSKDLFEGWVITNKITLIVEL